MTSLTASLRLLTSTLAMSLGLMPAWAQSAPAPQLSLELNAVQPSDKGCRLTFVVNNALGADLSKAAFEIALFNEAGIVDRLSVLDFKDLPAGKTKVIRFDLAGTECTKLSRVLINSATECAGVKPGACMRGLKTQTKTGIAFGV
ncbi:hypothetical protein NKH34_19015 [Mesorhizobium sp. M1148]|uniref:hypothetical protein n=1 Tax=unclassified Mesorhizobium TaxID=325217 RepID=UPI0003CE4BF2|nr:MULTISPECIES: hypothetical protein [unclassified Mesorhizobium]ESX16063.1 hypothetical protein X766_22410 [Mesorhizobium sp. LSJC255A00]ESX29783.1 hypothetical protein X765_12650 [Mesorhizobium sp. LSHC440B00]ESX35291.1 hypothetical protein X763_18220 [Mesorhizobium sp. LSHC432A00]ESX41504.1 hypothetical protein X764_14495 [Mesorhizobium sp. LSHC440A00]ESY32324.1 hypothetical protein X749_03975 [Mesorhizobium sp. LNJC391B00]